MILMVLVNRFNHNVPNMCLNVTEYLILNTIYPHKSIRCQDVVKVLKEKKLVLLSF